MSQTKEEFTSRLLTWYRENGRHKLPWQKNCEWYPRLLSEVMLQQTQVTTVIPKFEAFMKNYPTPEALASASDDEVMALWAGLGYYSRARNLLKAVRTIVFELKGKCPPTAKELSQLPGIGPSTAGAIASFVFNERAVMADGNAQRVLSRIFLVPGSTADTAFKKEIWSLAERLLPPEEDMPAYTQALMDFGALRCTRIAKCDGCPMENICMARLTNCVSNYPEKKKRKERPIRYLAVAFTFSGEEVWLQKRETKGVWRDLWLPLNVETTGEPKQTEIASLCGLDDRNIKRSVQMEVVVHDFTHYRVLIYPIVVDVDKTALPEGGLWLVEEEDGSVGMPTPIAKLLRDIRIYRRMMPSISSLNCIA